MRGRAPIQDEFTHRTDLTASQKFWRRHQRDLGKLVSRDEKQDTLKKLRTALMFRDRESREELATAFFDRRSPARRVERWRSVA